MLRTKVDSAKLTAHDTMHQRFPQLCSGRLMGKIERNDMAKAARKVIDSAGLGTYRCWSTVSLRALGPIRQ